MSTGRSSLGSRIVLLAAIAISLGGCAALWINTSASPQSPTPSPFNGSSTKSAATDTPRSVSPTLPHTATKPNFTNVNGYALTVPNSMRIAVIGFADNSLPEKADAVRIYEPGDIPLDMPHMTIVSLSKTDETLEQKARGNYEANINHTGIPATPVEALHPITFGERPAFQFAVRNKGFVSPIEEYLGYDGLYKVIWVETPQRFILITLTDTPDISQVFSTFEFTDK